MMVSMLFASLSSLTYGRGVVGYTTGVTRKLGVNDKATVNTPDRQFLDGRFWYNEGQKNEKTNQDKKSSPFFIIWIFVVIGTLVGFALKFHNVIHISQQQSYSTRIQLVSTIKSRRQLSYHLCVFC